MDSSAGCHDHFCACLSDFVVMNQTSLQTAKVVSALTDQGWSQIHVFGSFLAVVTLSQLQDQQAALGKETITRLHEEYFGQQAKPPLKRLAEAIRAVAAETDGSLQVVALSLVGQVLYLAILGEGRIVMRRGGKTATLLVGRGKLVTASGFSQPQDRFLLGNGDFFRLVDEKSIDRALASGQVVEAAEMLAPLTHERNGASLAAAAVIQIKPASESAAKSAAKMKAPLPIKEWLVRTRRRVLPVSWRAFYLQLQARPKQKSRQMMLTVALLLLLILGVSVFFGQKRLKNIKTTQQTTALIQQAQAGLQEVESLVSLNPVKAKQVLLEVKEILAQVEAPDLQARLDELWPQVVREQPVQPELYFDLGLIRNEATATDVVLSGDQVFILDAVEQAVYQVKLTNKQQKILPGKDELAEASQIAVIDDQFFVSQSKDLQAFGSNLYWLTDNGIEYAPADSQDKPQPWLKGKVVLSQPVSMAIDGSIWVVQADGQVLKFTRGQKEIFGIAGLDKPLLQPKMIFTSEDLDYLYILDSGNNRLVVLEKSGEYHRQYLWQDFGRMMALFADEAGGKIYVLDEHKIYSFKI